MNGRSVVASLRALPEKRPRVFLAIVAAIVALAEAVFFAVTPPRPSAFVPLFVELTTFAVAFDLFAGPRGNRRVSREMASLALAVAIFLLVFADLDAIMTMEKQQYFVAGGYLPVSDANGYVKGGLSLIELGHLDEWSSRRPLAVAFWGVLLKLTGQNLRSALFLQATLSWLCLSAAVREVVLRFGVAAATLFLALTLGHHAVYSGTFLTEPLGFSLGALGFALLLRGFGGQERKAVLGGLLLFGLALAARAGPTPALLLLVPYASFHFRGERRFDRKMLWQAAIAAGFPIAVSSLLLKAIGPADYMVQGNISYSLYGLAVGGKSWMQVISDHPELSRITSDTERSRIVYRAFWDAFKRQPSLFFQAFGRGLWRGLSSPFGTLFNVGGPLPFEAYLLPAIAGAVGLLRTVLRKGKDVLGFAVIVLATTFAFYPILADAWPRVLAPTIFFHAAVAAMGVASLVRARPVVEAPAAGKKREILLGASLALAAVVVLGPLALKALHPNLASLKAPACAAGEVPMAFRLARGASVPLDPKTRPTFVRGGLAFQDARTLADGARVITPLNLLAPDDVASHYVVVDGLSESPPDAGAIGYLCTRLVTQGKWWHNISTARPVPAP